MQNMPIGIFRGDDTDAFNYQTIVGTIKTDLDLTGCRAVFKYLSFSVEFDPISEDKKLTIVIPAAETKKFPPGLGYASLRVYDSEGKLKTFSNRIMVFVATKTPMFGSDEFEVDFNVRASLEPLKFFVGPNPDDFDEYRGYLEKVIDRASASKYGLAILLDAIDSDLGADDGVAATPVAVKAAYAAIIDKLTDDYYTAEQTEEAIDRVAAYYITYDAAGNPFPTYAALVSAQTVYSGGKVRIPTRNDYCVVLADETHDNAEYRYIYAVAEGQTTGSWQPQFPVEGVMTVDQSVTKDSQNPVSGGGVWSAIWGALTSLPGFSSIYDWCVAQLAGKEPLLQPLLISGSTIKTVSATVKDGSLLKPIGMPTSAITVNGKPLSSNVSLTGADIAVSESDDTKISAALADKATKADATLTERFSAWGTVYNGEGQQPYPLRIVKRGNQWVLQEDLSEGGAGTDWVDASNPQGNATSTEIEYEYLNTTVTATRTALQGYVLGSQTDKPLASEAEAEALRQGKQDALTAQQRANIAAVPNKANRAANPTAGNLAALDASGNLTDAGVKASDKLDSTSAAPAFSTDSSVSYPVGSHCTYNGKLYVCTTATTGGTWVAASWTAEDMTTPDATLDITAQNQLHVVAKDGTVLWAQGYDLASTSSATLACDATNNFTFADGATSQAFTLPTVPSGKVGDFGLDIDNSANASAATMTLTGLDTTFSVVVPEGESLTDMLAIAAGELARFYVTLTTFRVNSLPTWHIVKQVVENGGAAV